MALNLSVLVRRRRMVLNTLGLAETVPSALRPSLIVQRNAISKGLLGDSVFWKIVAVALFLRGPLEGTFGRKPERLGRYGVGPGHSVRVSTSKPLTRKQRKATGITKKELQAKARAELQDPNFRP
jgi:hypothetical protein